MFFKCRHDEAKKNFRGVWVRLDMTEDIPEVSTQTCLITLDSNALVEDKEFVEKWIKVYAGNFKHISEKDTASVL